VALIAACSRSPQQVERVALLPFENLSGDATLDWVGQAAPVIVTAQITGLPRVFPLSVVAVRDAYLANATRLVHGYFTGRSDALHFQIEVEDAARHKMVDTAAVEGTILEATNIVARRLFPGARAFQSSNAAAIEAWGRGDNDRALALDPDFGAAWLARVQSIASAGDTQRAVEVAAQALARSSLRSEVERARLELASATLRKDPAARTNALTALARLITTDVDTIRQLAGLEVNARHFATGAELYRSILRLSPDDAQAMNGLGYATALAGDLEAARKAFDDYRRQPRQEANAFDSLGEAYFMNGRFQDAEKSFLEAHGRDAAMLEGADLFKAAYARWLTGDLKGADVTMRRYLDFRAGLHDPLLDWREAAWLYTTGRRHEAIAKLQTTPASPLMTRQLAIWRGMESPPKDGEALKNSYERTPPAVDGQVRTFYASALLEAGQKDEAKKLLTLWPLPETGGDPLLQSLVFPRFLELRRSVGLQ
jgi:tetratricopeptide (TPR) repeat protein